MNAQNEKSIDKFIGTQIAKADSLRKSHKLYEEAIGILKNTLGHGEISQASSSSKSNIYHKIGVNYLYQGDHENSILFLDSAITIRKTFQGEKLVETANSFFLRGLVKQRAGFLEPAINDFKNAIELIELFKEKKETLAYRKKRIQYYSLIGNGYRDLGDVGQAKKYYDEVYNLIEETYGKISEATAGFSSSRGVYYVGIGDTVNGFKNYYRAIEIYLALDEEKFTSQILDTKNNIAAAHLEFRQYKLAQDIFKEIILAIDANKASYTEKEYNEKLRFYYSNLAYTERTLGNYPKARAFYNKALKISSRESHSGYNVNLARAFEGLGDIDREEGNLSESQNNYQKAIKSLCLDFSPDNVFELPSILSTVIIDQNALKRILALKAQVFAQQYIEKRERQHLIGAFNTYQSLDSLIGQIRQSYQSELSRYDMVEGTLPIYEKATQTALKLFELENDQKFLQAAFNFSSKNKAIVLLEGKQDENAKVAGIPGDLLKEEKDLKKELNQVEQEIFALEQVETRDQSKIDSAKQMRFTISRSYEKLIDLFESNYPAYHELKYSISQAVDADEIARQLPANSALIEYFIGFDSLLIFTISKQGLSYYSLEMPADFVKSCRAYRKAAEQEEVQMDLTAYASLANRLYATLLEKPLSGLANQQINRLFIVPDYYLYELSFDALFYQSPNQEQLAAGWGVGELPYLIRKYALSYAYSNRLLFDEQQKRNTTNKLFAGFGLNYLKEDWKGSLASASRALGRDWKEKIRPLPFAVEEVQEIGKLLHGDTWLNEEATKINFETHGAEYQILHLAMHGIVEKEFPINSALIFDRQKDSTNFLLTAGDLYTSTLNADMVVLSACDTGSGQLQKGEGAMTLARAFKHAGCPSLVASLWSAADEPTKNLMVAFYKNLKKGLPKDLALQQAKISYLDQGRSPTASTPHYWSHIAIIGDSAPIDFGGNEYVNWILGLALLGFVVFGYFKWK